MNIQKTIEKHDKHIFTGDYPAWLAANLLVSGCGYSYAYAKREFTKYCKKNNKLCNIAHF